MVRKTIYKLRNGNGWILVIVSVAWLFGLGIRFVYPALLPYIQVEFEMDFTTAGVLLTLLWVGYGTMQFPGGLLADRLGERNILAGSIFLAMMGTVLVVFAPTIATFFAGTLLVGVGLCGTTRVTVLVDMYPRCSGTAIGLNQAAGNVGTSVLPIIAGILSVSFSWRWGFGF